MSVFGLMLIHLFESYTLYFRSMVPLEKEDYRHKNTRGPVGQKMLNFTTPGDRHETVIEDLLPYTLYNVTGIT